MFEFKALDHDAPGPAQYGRLLDSFSKQSEAGKRTSSAFSFGRAGRFATHRKQHLGKGFESERLGAESLGPAAYQRPPEDVKAHRKAHSKGRRNRARSTSKSRGSAGPTQMPFSPLKTADFSASHARPGSAHPFSCRRAKGVDSFGPQPLATKRSGVSHRFPTATRECASRAGSTQSHMDRGANKNILSTPAPGDYLVRSSIKYIDAQPRGAAFGTEKRLRAAHEMSRFDGRALDRTRLGVESPGPGEYSPRDGIEAAMRQRAAMRVASPRTTTLGSAPRFQQTSRERESSELPGPGDYDDFVSGAIGRAEGRRGALDAVEEEEEAGVAEREALGRTWVLVVAAEKAEANSASHRNGTRPPRDDPEAALARSTLLASSGSRGGAAGDDAAARAALPAGQRVRPGAAIRPFSARPFVGGEQEDDEGRDAWGEGDSDVFAAQERVEARGGAVAGPGAMLSARRRGTLRRRSPRDSYSTIVGAERVVRSSPPRGRRTPGWRFGTSTREHPILFGAPGNVLFEQHEPPVTGVAARDAGGVRPATAGHARSSSTAPTSPAGASSASRTATASRGSGAAASAASGADSVAAVGMQALRPSSAVHTSPRMVRVRARTVFGTATQIRR